MIDQNYIQSKTNSQLPFFEFSITKQASFDILLRHFTEVFGQPNPKKGRLLVQEQVIGGLKLVETLDEFGLQNGQLIWVEFLQSNNTWPTDVYKAAQKAKGSGEGEAPSGSGNV